MTDRKTRDRKGPVPAREIRRAWAKIPDGTLYAAQQVARQLGCPVSRVLDVIYPQRPA
jgi:hypothetical protein